MASSKYGLLVQSRFNLEGKRRLVREHGMFEKSGVKLRESTSLYTSLGAHQAGAYPGFRSMKRLGVFLLPLDGMLVHRRVTPSSKFASTHLYTWVERGTMRVKCLAQEHNAVPRPELETGPFDRSPAH